MLLDEVESNEEVSDTEFVLKNNLDYDIVPDEQLNNVLIPEANIHFIEDADSEVNKKESKVKSEQEILKKEKDKGKKGKKERYGF